MLDNICIYAIFGFKNLLFILKKSMKNILFLSLGVFLLFSCNEDLATVEVNKKVKRVVEKKYFSTRTYFDQAEWPDPMTLIIWEDGIWSGNGYFKALHTNGCEDILPILAGTTVFPGGVLLKIRPGEAAIRGDTIFFILYGEVTPAQKFYLK